MPRQDGMTTPIGGDTGTTDWGDLGPEMLRDVGKFLPDLRKEIDALPVGTRATLINRYDELAGAYETWCQRAGVGIGAGFAAAKFAHT